MDANQKAVPLGYAQVTDLSAVVGLPPVGNPAAIPDGPNVVAVLVAETQDVRWRDDGTDPTATVGMLLKAGTEFVYTGTLSKIKLLQAAATAKLNVSYYRLIG